LERADQSFGHEAECIEVLFEKALDDEIVLFCDLVEG
jgi:hypothetical protein